LEQTTDVRFSPKVPYTQIVFAAIIISLVAASLHLWFNRRDAVAHNIEIEKINDRLRESALTHARPARHQLRSECGFQQGPS
jgi:hypothetical protein